MLAPVLLKAQQIEKFYTYDWKETGINTARFYSLVVKKDSVWYRTDYYLYEKKLQMEGYYVDSTCKVPYGLFRYYHPNGLVSSTGEFFYGKRNGTWTSYYSNGNMRDSANYDLGAITGNAYSWHSNGYLADSTAFNSDGSSVSVSWFEDGTPAAAGRRDVNYKKHGTWQYFHRNGVLSAKEVFQNGTLVTKLHFDEQGAPTDTSNVDRPAIFQDGLKDWQKHVKRRLYFPSQYKLVNADRIVVIVEGVIDEQGRMTEVEVTTSFHPDFDRIAVQMMKASPKWKPAVQHNRNVKHKVRQAVYFAQDEE
jgi:antitoxin component YwqK of YwqJK toxin-antitoxin module